MRTTPGNCCQSETLNGITFTRYAFLIDGPAFARLVRDQTEEAMRQKGDLPPGISFEISAYYADMIGRGELWVGMDGLPLRQMLELRFPAENNESISANIKVDYSGFGSATLLSSGSGSGTVGTLSPNALSASVARQLLWLSGLQALAVASFQYSTRLPSSNQ